MVSEGRWPKRSQFGGTALYACSTLILVGGASREGRRPPREVTKMVSAIQRVALLK